MPHGATSDLIDAQQMHRDYPDTFTVPSPERLDALRPGDYVKVCRHEERFWVRLHGVDSPVLIGTVANDLEEPGNTDLSYGSLLYCERRHIYAIMTAEELGPEYSRVN
jgi:hypothetical protein